MDQKTETKPRTLPLGIHFGLDEDVYHADPALGSSDMRKLRKNPSDYWYESAYNPLRPQDEDKGTPSQIRGRALHALILEGEARFDSTYMRGPDIDPGLKPSDKAQITKAANKEAEDRGLICLKAVEYDRIAIAAAMIVKNPKLSSAFMGGIPEVSIFWERDGIRRKARIDYLKIKGNGDLKGIANWRGDEFPKACRDAIARYRYDMQAKHYSEARDNLPKLVADGLVFGDHDAALLKKIAAVKRHAFQFVFFQMESSPVTWSCVLSPNYIVIDPETGQYEEMLGNPILEVAARDLEIAAANYRDYMKRFGPDNMWLLIEEPQELAIEEMPNWWR